MMQASAGRAPLPRSVLGATGLAAIVVLWEIAARAGLLSPAVLPSPSMALAQVHARLGFGDVAVQIGVSLGRIVSGFLLGAAAGIGLALLAGWYRLIGNLVRPIVELLRPIPPLAWIPLAIVWFGLGEPSKVFVIFIGAFFPIFTNAYRGVTGVDPLLVRAAQTMDVSGLRLFGRVILPAALPDIATGLRVGWGLAFGVLVAAELVASDAGLGYMIMNARQLGDVAVVVFGILTIGTLNLVTDWWLALLIRSRLGTWHAT